MSEVEHRASKNLEAKIQSVLQMPQNNEEFFASIGTVSATAIFRREKNLLDTLYKGIESRRTMSDLPLETNFRLHGNASIIAGSALKIRQGKDLQHSLFEETNFADELRRKQRYEWNKAELSKLTDSILQSATPLKYMDIVTTTVEAIILADADSLQVGRNQIERLAASKTPALIFRASMKGMLDVVKPASEKLAIFSSLK